MEFTHKIAIETEKGRSLAKDTLLVLAWAVLTGISAHLKVDLGPIPLTMQTLVVLTAPVILGKNKAVLSQLTYLTGGMLGVAWFSRGGGPAYILSPTFGYLLGFLGSCFFVGSVLEKRRSGPSRILLVMLLGNALIYLPGLLWLSFFIPQPQILTVGLYPFIAGDMIKIAAASLLTKILKE